MNSEHTIVTVKAISYIHYKIRNKCEEEKLFANGLRLEHTMFELKNLESSDIICLLNKKYHWTWYLQHSINSLYHNNHKESIMYADFFHAISKYTMSIYPILPNITYRLFESQYNLRTEKNMRKIKYG